MASIESNIGPQVAKSVKDSVGLETPTAKLFTVERSHDLSGVSGTGTVAEGVQFSDGTIAMRWLSGRPTTTIFNSIEDLLVIHGHGGSTTVKWKEEQE